MMNERRASIATPLAPPAKASLPPTTSIIPGPEALPGQDQVDDYTIKCICDYADDDGNTIYCEDCDSWQHIECFYPGRQEEASKDEFDHACADCKPRYVDRRAATERQRQQRQNRTASDGPEKKTKRPAAKSHKKKTKPADLQVNGFHEADGRASSPRESHTTHKKKGHRASQSMGSQIKRSPSYHPLHAHANPPSPVLTPPDHPLSPEMHSYSDTFRTLYEHEAAVQIQNTNSFASLNVPNTMALWLHDPNKLREETGNQKDDLEMIKQSVDTPEWPELLVERKETKVGHLNLVWKSLVTPRHLNETNVHGGIAIGELNGHLGFQQDYYTDKENRWVEAPHPRPLIFFPPRLPLFIDTRKEGSLCRYVRRSCRPNTSLETFIVNGLEYHFWLTSERPLAAREQITIAWDFHFPPQIEARYLSLLNLADDEAAPSDSSEATPEEYDALTNVINFVLSDHGGCACDLANDCAFARFRRNHHGRAHANPHNIKSKKGRKQKPHISPSSTGHATNSRAASEGQQEPYDDDDNRSTSGSTRSKPHSRDLTPLHGAGEVNGLISEPSDREKRKLAMLEDSFRKMEQAQPARKKKRPSADGTNMTTTAVPSHPKPRQKSTTSKAPPSTTNGNGTRGHQYVDAGTSRGPSGSPYSGISPTAPDRSPPSSTSRRGSAVPAPSPLSSTGSRVVYADASIQTDPVEGQWYSFPLKPPEGKQRRIVSLAQRLLDNRRKIRERQERAKREASVGLGQDGEQAAASVPMDLDAVEGNGIKDEQPIEQPSHAPETVSPAAYPDSASADVEMADAPIVETPAKPQPPIWPETANALLPSASLAPANKAPQLRVQMPTTSTVPPSRMSATTPGTSATPGSTPKAMGGLPLPSPLSTTVANGVNGTNSANGANHAPTPIKKKLTLSDYSRMKSSAKPTGTSPTVTPAVLKTAISDDMKPTGIVEGTGIVASPSSEKGADPVGKISVNGEAGSKD